MSARTTLTLANGRGVDLAAPQFTASDFTALAEHLAKEKRFNGATPDVEYSVAEHCCLGADAILHEGEITGRMAAELARETAGYFLMHDLHEALIKDVTTPLKVLIAEIAEEKFGVLSDHILGCFALIELRLDVALHQAAGLRWPPPPGIAPLIKVWDKIMFVTEWRDLMGGVEHPDWAPYRAVEPIKDRITRPWPWRVARDAWLRRAKVLLPALQMVAA